MKAWIAAGLAGYTRYVVGPDVVIDIILNVVL